MTFDPIQSWYQLATEVCVAFDTVLNAIVDATVRNGNCILAPAGGYKEHGKRWSAWSTRLEALSRERFLGGATSPFVHWSG